MLLQSSRKKLGASQAIKFTRNPFAFPTSNLSPVKDGQEIPTSQQYQSFTGERATRESLNNFGQANELERNGTHNSHRLSTSYRRCP
jgi:hypothetical protein